MNNKGQSLIAFILLLPVMFVFILGIWEIGNISYFRSNVDRSAESALNFGLKHIEEDDVQSKILKVLDKNFEGTKEVVIENDKIVIKVKCEYHNLYSKYIKPIEFSKTYIGRLENEKIIIEKEG